MCAACSIISVLTQWGATLVIKIRERAAWGPHSLIAPCLPCPFESNSLGKAADRQRGCVQNAEGSGDPRLPDMPRARACQGEGVLTCPPASHLKPGGEGSEAQKNQKQPTAHVRDRRHACARAQSVDRRAAGGRRWAKTSASFSRLFSPPTCNLELNKPSCTRADTSLEYRGEQNPAAPPRAEGGGGV